MQGAERQRAVDRSVRQPVDQLLRVGTEVAARHRLGDLLADDVGRLHRGHDRGARARALGGVGCERRCGAREGGRLHGLLDGLLRDLLGAAAQQLVLDRAAVLADRVGGRAGEDRAELLAGLRQRLPVGAAHLAHLQVGVACCDLGHVQVKADDGASSSTGYRTRSSTHTQRRRTQERTAGSPDEPTLAAPLNRVVDQSRQEAREALDGPEATCQARRRGDAPLERLDALVRVRGGDPQDAGRLLGRAQPAQCVRVDRRVPAGLQRRRQPIDHPELVEVVLGHARGQRVRADEGRQARRCGECLVVLHLLRGLCGLLQVGRRRRLWDAQHLRCGQRLRFRVRIGTLRLGQVLLRAGAVGRSLHRQHLVGHVVVVGAPLRRRGDGRRRSLVGEGIEVDRCRHVSAPPA